MGKMFSKKKKTEITSRIGKDINCPLCSMMFNSSTNYSQLNTHIIECAQNVEKEVFITKMETKQEEIEIQYEKTNILKKKRSIEKIPFDTKITNLKNSLQIKKIDWRDAHCKLEINRENMLVESMNKYKSIDPMKELKINFIGEISHDAGGIIREWFTLLIKDLQSTKLNLFERGDTNEFSYIIKKSLKKTSKNMEYFNFIGKLIAKSLLDNITLNLCFNKLLYKLILNEEILFTDLVFIDKPLYNSLKELRKSDHLANMELYYVIDYNDDNGKLVQDELVKDGANTLVIDLDDYILKRINYIVEKSMVFVKEIQLGLYETIPYENLESFNSDEFELLLNGQPYIDVEDWKMHTNYQGKFNASHKVIIRFWEIMFSLSQEQLSKLLQFSTGSSRVPIGGFSVIESNRGEVAKFTILSVNYNTKSKNYIKSHTCFNRIELPLFPDEQSLADAVKFVIENEIVGFGID